MRKYKKAKIVFEDKAIDKKRKPIYATRKLSIGLVSCMLGVMLFVPTSKADEENPLPTSEQIEKNTQPEQTQDLKAGLEETTNEKTPENNQEELLTFDEIQAIRNRANSLEKSYFFNGDMVEELKAELRKAKADPSINYEKAKARLIDEAIVKNTPKKEAPGEVRALNLKTPTINTVSPGSKEISGGGLEGKGKRTAFNKDCIIHVTVKDQGGVEIETAQVSIGPKGGSTWKVTLQNEVKAGYKIYVKQEFNDEFSDEATATVKELISDSYKDKLTMPKITVKSEDLHVLEADAVEDIINAFKSANKEKIADGNNFEENLYTPTGPNDTKKPIVVAGNGKTITVNFSDGSSLTLDVSDKVTTELITETSTAPIINTLKIIDGKITGKVDLTKVGNLKRLRVKIVELSVNSAKDFCTDNGCTIDKNSRELGEASVDQNTGEFSYDLPDTYKLELGKNIGVIVKEYQKKNSCSTVQPSLVEPKVYVRDPKKLTDKEKGKIIDAIRNSNKKGDESKLPDGTGYISEPAFIEFDNNGNVRIISPNDVEVTWDNGNPIYQKNDDGSYKLQAGKEANVITLKVENLVKNLQPKQPKIEEKESKIVITPDEADTDIIEHTVTYTGIDRQEKKIVAKYDLVNSTWSITEGAEFASIDSKTGIISIEKSKIKHNTDVKASVKDNGEYINNDDKKESEASTKTIEKSKADQVTELGGLDPADIKKWVGDDLNWKDGVKAKDDTKATDVKELLDEATTSFVGDSRNTNTAGKFKGTIKVNFGDGSSIEVKDQTLYVSDHVTGISNKNTPDDAIEVEFKLGKGTKIDNTDGTSIDGKDDPVTYQKYKVKPGTDLKTYENPTLKTNYFDLIDKKVKAQDNFIDPKWNTDKFKVTDQNKVFTATATEAYNVTVKANGGTGDDKVEKVKKGGIYKLPEANTFTPQNENQEFSGWKVGDDTTLKNPGDQITITGDTEVKAIWKAIEFKVQFKTGEGAKGSMKDETVIKGSEFELPTPTFSQYEGKKFAGWKVGDGTELKQVGEKIKISGDVTLTAIWKDIEYKVSFNGNKGSGTMTGSTVKKGEKYKLPENKFTPPSDKQEFKAWEVDGKEVAVGTEITIDKDTEIKAIWKDIEYKVSFNGNKGTGNMSEQKVKKGDEYVLPENTFIAPKNKTFSHWKIGNEEKKPGDKITVNGDTEVIAIWKDAEVKISYNANGGSGEMKDETLTKGSTYKLLANGFTAPKNKKFKAWKIGDKEYAEGSEITIDQDTKIEAIWEDIKVNISYDGNGGTGKMNGAEITKGSKYKLSANGFKAPEGKTFDGWMVGTEKKAVGDKITVNADTEVKAVWKDIEYKVSFNGNTGTGKMEEKLVKKGNEYELPENGFKAPEGKTFDGWMVGTEKKAVGDKIKVNSDIEVKAIWKDKASTQNPNKPVEPGKPGEKPVEPGKPGEDPSKPGEKPVEPGKPGKDPSKPGEKPVEPGKPGEDPSKPGEKPVEPGKPGEETNKPEKTKPSESVAKTKRKIEVKHTTPVNKEIKNVKTGVESVAGAVAGLIAAAGGLFASKKRKK